MATRLRIVERRKERPMTPSGPDVFGLEEMGSIPTEQLLADPGWSLFCFDFVKQLALFVETPPAQDLTEPPFYYAAQHEHAISVASLPLEEFERVAESLPWPDRVTFVQSTGRCGSTLISKAFGAVPGVQSLSEPDDFSQINLARIQGSMDDALAVRLTRASTKWRGMRSGFHTLALKTRGEVMLLSRIIHEACPSARNIFMYRSAEAWSRSSYAMAAAFGNPEDAAMLERMQAFWTAYDPKIAAYSEKRGPLSYAELRAYSWCERMMVYLDVFHAGLPFRGLRYEDLVERPQAVLARAFDFVGLEVVDWDPVLRVFERDSQEGSQLSRAELKKKGKPISQADLDAVLEVVRSHAELGAPDVVLPGTLADD